MSLICHLSFLPLLPPLVSPPSLISFPLLSSRPLSSFFFFPVPFLHLAFSFRLTILPYPCGSPTCILISHLSSGHVHTQATISFYVFLFFPPVLIIWLKKKILLTAYLKISVHTNAYKRWKLWKLSSSKTLMPNNGRLSCKNYLVAFRLVLLIFY